MAQEKNNPTKPQELHMEQIDASVSDITEAASYADQLRSFGPVHLLGDTLSDGGDMSTIENEMRFALGAHQKISLRQQTDLVEDVEAKSTVSSLTNDSFPSFDEL
jgi:hypothetical protein